MASTSEYNAEYYRTNREREKSRSLDYYHVIGKDRIDRESRKLYMREYLRTHPRKMTQEQKDAKNERRRSLYAQDPSVRDRQRTEAKRWQQENPRKRKAQRLKAFGITHEQFDALMAAQRSVCAICGTAPRGDKRRFPVVDHDHGTGAVRGILCSNCNQGIGHFKDNPALLLSAIEYLHRTAEPEKAAA